MSGGVAYVWDPEARFLSRCNPAVVELEPVADAAGLKALVEAHLHWTGSRRAAALLERWPETLAQFVMVMPTEYRRALTDLAQEAAA
jgi:glutamate synthase domain-containing protein 3